MTLLTVFFTVFVRSVCSLTIPLMYPFTKFLPLSYVNLDGEPSFCPFFSPAHAFLARDSALEYAALTSEPIPLIKPCAKFVPELYALTELAPLLALSPNDLPLLLAVPVLLPTPLAYSVPAFAPVLCIPPEPLFAPVSALFPIV